jgi:scyllo-inositol 2-dehydrogenase (NADP+)
LVWSGLDGARLWRVASRNLERARAFAERHGAAAPVAAYEHLSKMLGDPARDAVVIATPDKLHAEAAAAAARAGKHVLDPEVPGEEGARNVELLAEAA